MESDFGPVNPPTVMLLILSAMAKVLLSLALAPAAGSPADAVHMSRALGLFLLVVAVLGLLILGIVLAMIAQRLRRNRRAPKAAPSVPDPWREAAKRVQVYPQDGDQSAE